MDGAADHSPAHLALRERTRTAHEAAEATAGMRALMSGAMDASGYHELLAAQCTLFSAWEAERAADIAATAETWRYASRVPQLEFDLSVRAQPPVGARAVGDMFRGGEAGPEAMTRTASPTGWAPTEKWAPTEWAPTGKWAAAEQGHTAGRAAFWGELYVIEGSTLGGRVIVRRLRERFPTLPHAFYAMGENAPGRWRDFQRVLDHALADDASQRLAIDGALRMFARFQRTLQDPGHHV